MKLKKALSLLFTLIVFSSCSVFQMGDNYAKRKFQRAGLEHIVLDTEKYVFSYWDTGEADKPVYVLFHGYGTSTHLQWFKQAQKISKTHRLIIPNLLFFGSKTKGQARYGLQDQVDAMSVLLKELKIDSLIVGGTSYGGLVAAELAQQEKDKILKLTIFSSPLKFFDEKDLSSMKVKEEISDVSELLVPGDLEMMRKFTNIVLFKDRKVPRFILADIQKNLFQDEEKNSDLRKLLNEIQKSNSYMSSREYEFDFPVLLVWGAKDELIPARVGMELDAYFPTSELHIIPKSGHVPQLEKKRKFNKILIDFLMK